MTMSERITFTGGSGAALAARLDLPSGPVRARALFAHCFTCSKDLFAVQRIATALAERGIAVLRFDFTGLGASEGEFANTDFSSNVGDLRRAAAWLGDRVGPADLLIGHSLGGAAVLAAAGDLPDVKAVVAIAAPSSAEHVLRSFRAEVPAIEAAGEAVVTLAGRRFTIRRQFLEDVRARKLHDDVARLRRPLLVLHSPRDAVVGIENAREIFEAAHHPKSFVSLDDADHLLSRREDAAYAAEVIGAWSGRYLATGEAAAPEVAPAVPDAVTVRATGRGRFEQHVDVAGTRLLADEPVADGGLGSGPNPYDFLAVALGACTSMTIALYAAKKRLELPPFSVVVRHRKDHAADCADCVDGKAALVDVFERRIAFDREVTAELAAKVLEIAEKCPVHRTLTRASTVTTTVGSAAAPA